jgi:ABC-type antimicrobial peptide transport system permease subunit
VLDERDRPGAPLVAVISASLARAAFPSESPLGQHLRLGGSDAAPPYTIVGVVGDVKQQSLAVNQAQAVYITATQWRWVDSVMSIVVRARSDAAALAPAVRQAIWSVDKDQPIVRVATMDELVAATAAERRFLVILFEVFAIAALLLAAAGIYGVLAGSVTERTREIGIRAVLGASRGMIVALVIRQGLALTGLGVAIGLGGAVFASQGLVAMLFSVSHLDPVTYAGVVVLLVVVALLACAVPAWRASRVDPAQAIKAE